MTYDTQADRAAHDVMMAPVYEAARRSEARDACEDGNDIRKKVFALLTVELAAHATTEQINEAAVFACEGLSDACFDFSRALSIGVLGAELDTEEG